MKPDILQGIRFFCRSIPRRNSRELSGISCSAGTREQETVSREDGIGKTVLQGDESGKPFHRKTESEKPFYREMGAGNRYSGRKNQ